MRLTVQSFALQSARVRAVLDYIGAHLDEDIRLSRLADLACLSPSQLERLYWSKVRETPMATLRRLRLKRAHEQIRQGGSALIDAALAASYNSHAAFTRAFVRQFGYAPSQLPRIGKPLETPPTLRLETLPTRKVYQITYNGRHRDHRREVGQLVGSLAVGGAKHWRNWAVLDRDQPLSARPHSQVQLSHFVPAAGQPDDIRGVDHVTHMGGLYAVHEALAHDQPRHLCALLERIREELGCQFADAPFGGQAGGRILLRELKVGGYTAPQERRTALYIPVVPIGKSRLAAIV